MTAEPVWEEPPGIADGLVLADLAAYLRANPGQSALVGTFAVADTRKARQAASNITNAFWAAFKPRHAFFASSQTVPGPDGDLVVKVWARYLGEPQEQPARRKWERWKP